MQRGFSLVELSIVLVILGLLTGGILAGQSLIRAAEVRSVILEYQRIASAAHTFRDKYMAVPGDMRNATSFWNRAINQTWCVTNTTASVTSPGTCDGNGNGFTDNPAAASQSGERFQVWRQLTLAGLYEGDYTGIAGSAGATDHVTGQNCPPMRISSQACWVALGRGISSGSTGFYFAADYGNTLVSGTGGTHALILRPEEAWSVDTKIDDGKPAIGQLISIPTLACSGTTDQSNRSAEYALTQTGLNCPLYFLRMF